MIRATRLSAGTVRRRCAHPAASFTAKSIRSGTASYAVVIACVSGCRLGACLKPTARVRIRPSSSGSATFIARSRAVSPAPDAAQSVARLADRTSWNTGASTAPKGPADTRLGIAAPPPPGSDTAKLVRFRITSADPCCKRPAMMPPLSASFRLAPNSGSGFSPAARQRSASASIGARSPACISAR